MIQKISQVNSGISFNKGLKKGQNGTKAVSGDNPSRIQQYTDSFVKHTAESAPMLLAFTAMWSVIDNVSRSVPIKKAVINNMTNFFLPVTIVSSAVLAALENRKTSKN